MSIQLDYEIGNDEYMSGIHDVLLSAPNINMLTQKIYSKVRSDGDPSDIKVVRSVVARELSRYVQTINDVATVGEYEQTIDQANTIFVKRFPLSLVRKYVDVNDSHQSTAANKFNRAPHADLDLEYDKNEHMRVDWNPIRELRAGKLTRMETVEDIKNIDAWSDGAVSIDDKSRRKPMKGINNPYIIGAHRRYYDKDVASGFRTVREIGPTKNRGYNMEAIYSTVGNNKTIDWEC
jgi:hypothetical protein